MGEQTHLRLARDSRGNPEVFRSVQGEGPMAGRVRTFVRLSGCNLHCVWCDTAYTWNWLGSGFAHERDAPGRPHKFDPGLEVAKLSVADVAALVDALPASEAVVITGGEPLMQRAGLAALVAARKARGLGVEIETNGTIAPSAELAAGVDLFVVSPKLAHSGNDPALALNRDALTAFAALTNAAFKFVARTPGDVVAIATLADELGVAPGRVWVMPEGAESELVRERGRQLVDAIAARGFNYSDRLHIHLYGGIRGA